MTLTKAPYDRASYAAALGHRTVNRWSLEAIEERAWSSVTYRRENALPYADSDIYQLVGLLKKIREHCHLAIDALNEGTDSHTPMERIEWMEMLVKITEGERI